MTKRKPQPQTEEQESKPFSRKDFINSVIKKKQKNKFLSEHQEDYYNILKSNQITIASGPAGVGKSFIAMKAASYNLRMISFDFLKDRKQTLRKFDISKLARTAM